MRVDKSDARVTQEQLPILIIGMGSPHGDDQFGWLAARQLRESSVFMQAFSEPVEVCLCRTPLDGFLDYARDSRAIIVLDAVISGAPVGSLVRVEEEDLPGIQLTYSSHGQSVVHMLELGRALAILPRHVVVIGVELAACTAYGPMGRELEQTLLRCQQLVIAEIQSILASNESGRN